MNASRDLETRIAEIIRKRGIRPATDEEIAAKDREIRQEQAEEKARILLGRLDARYRGATVNHVESRRWLFEYRAGNRHGYVILGKRGVGKSWEACAIARELMLQDYVPVTVVPAGELIAALRPNQDGTSDLGQFQVAPVLVIDDLGAERQTEWSEDQLFHLADFRNVRRLPTIITSNLTGPQIRDRYDGRTVDRLVEDSTLLTIKTAPWRETPF